MTVTVTWMLEPSVQKDHLTTLSKLGQALWPDIQQAEHRTVEAYLQEPELERAALVMFSQALMDGARATAPGIHLPFFRLTTEERLILTFLHNQEAGRFSYIRLGKLLSKAPEVIETMAWSARVRLAASNPMGAHPTGSAHFGVSCPEYDFTRPWTQRFFDDEVKPQERLFMQRHMMACLGCREALGRCRQLYYSVEAELQLLQRAEMPALERIFRRVEKTQETISSKSSLGLLGVWLSHWDVRIALAAGVGLILIRILV